MNTLQHNKLVTFFAFTLVIAIHMGVFIKIAYSYGRPPETVLEVSSAIPLMMHMNVGEIPTEAKAGELDQEEDADTPPEEEELEENKKIDETPEEDKPEEETPIVEDVIEPEPEIEPELQKKEDLLPDPLPRESLIATQEEAAEKIVQPEPAKVIEEPKPAPKPTPKPIPKPKPAPKPAPKPKSISKPRAQAAVSPNKVFSESDVSVLNKPSPVYPRIAQKRRLEGTVYIVVNINERGTVNWVKVKKSSGHAALDSAAERAARRIRLKPYMVNGVPQAINVSIPYQFKI